MTKDSVRIANMLVPDRPTAWNLLCEYTQKPALIKHALAVEAAMRACANKFAADEELWGITGLLHDFDYERYPDPKEHTVVGGKILRDKGYPETMVHAIYAHNEQNGMGLQRRSPLDKALFACDELAGFITAVALVRPSKSLHDLKPKSVLKKFKENAFAAAVSRADMLLGMEGLGVEPTEHIQMIINAMRSIATDLELEGTVERV